ncbi:ketosynthase chain-length factor [Actinoallomurus bryophytorum]|uniref:Minimal PKS chain-length factor (CLF/KS beta) n=1 Tax=Actinoallomurus bryophytorum TaxID=1490222 RepID=A0A543CUL5_9ACTN|nr:beta-ketoacyl synthase N-terminal-like domain-containing protein [Actinoallomurus bryophytorum]TQM00805.1 minimal PKS chain-length factor (CLF/KS beta) [Actinoallomurus bryophytorum]
MTRRAVITGIGVTAPSGVGAAAHWDTVLKGENRIGRISLFDPARYPVTLAGEVRGFVPTDHVASKLRVQTDRWTWLGLAAADEAFGDAALDPAGVPPYEIAATLASSSGGNLFGQKELQRLWSNGTARQVGAYQSIAWFYAASVGQVTIKHGLKGASSVLCAESAGGLDSLAHAARTIRRGASVVLAGGTECPLSPYALVCQLSKGQLTTRTDPERAYRPFDVDADGYVPAEGGAIFVVENLDDALARGAPYIYGEVAGWGATHDAVPAHRSNGGSVRHYARAMSRALETSGLDPADIDLVLPDALGVPAFDVSEAEAMRSVFGVDALPVVTTQKALVGRMYQGGAALDVATALLAMRHRYVPGTAGIDQPAPGCELNFAYTSHRAAPDAAMVNARGYDGFNSSVVIRRYPRETEAQ